MKKNILYFALLFCLGLFPSNLSAFNIIDTGSISVSATVQSTSPAIHLIDESYVNKSGVILFRGYAYPNALIILTRNGELFDTVTANSDASFEISLSQIDLGNYLFSLGAKEVISGDLSTIFKFNLNIERGTNIIIDGILFPPTLHSNYSEIQRGDLIKFFGRTAPGATVDFSIGPVNFLSEILADDLGYWALNYDSRGLKNGSYLSKARASFKNFLSIYSPYLGFLVGEKKVLAPTEQVKPTEVEIPLFPLVAEKEKPQIIPSSEQISVKSYSYWYLLLLLLPILLLLLERKIIFNKKRKY